MLLHLNIHNIALIDEVSIELGEGLNILTGETGAGKSIIIDSINAVLGDRVSKEIIRTGSDKALVEAVFQIDVEQIKDILDEMGMEPEEGGILILSREIAQSGRNTSRVNGKMVAASFLKAIGERLIDLHGQYDNQSLLKTDNHIELLDSFGGGPIQAIKQEYALLLDQYKETKYRLRTLSGDPGERERKSDLLRFQIDEIGKAKLKPGEETDLNKEKMLLTNAGKILSSLSTAYNLLSSGESGGQPALDAMNEALSSLDSISRLEDSFEDLRSRLQELIFQLSDIAEEVRRNNENADYNPARLEEIEERLDLIYRLKRKYGSNIDEIHNYRTLAEKQLAEIEKSEETVALLTERLAKLDAQLYKTCLRLNAERINASLLLEKMIGQQLDDLEMKRAKFKVDILFDDAPDAQGRRKYAQHGLDRVEFLISANVGEPLKPLARIASGGEMSRIMLAIKTILAEVDRIPTLIFDEIDMGISGKAAKRVGEKLSFISARRQVLCVTHLPQIACIADNHYLIEKIVGEKRTKTIVTLLDADNVVKEITRLIGSSEATEISLKYAQEMINNAKKNK